MKIMRPCTTVFPVVCLAFLLVSGLPGQRPSQGGETPGLSKADRYHLALVVVPKKDEAVRHPVQFSEIHFMDRASEFIEFVNTGAEPIDISGWKLEKGVRFTFPQDTILQPDRYLVVSGKQGEIIANAFGPFEGRLDNAGERLRLVDGKGDTITDVRYTSPPAIIQDTVARRFDGSAGQYGSWQRLDLARDGDDPRNWVMAAPTPGSKATSRGPAPVDSVYQIRHTPDQPEADRPVRLQADFAYGGDLCTLIFYAEINGRRFEVKQELTGPMGDYQLKAAIPGVPAMTAVRYGFALITDRVRQHFPSQSEPAAGYWIPAGKAIETPPPLYQLWIDPAAWDQLQTRGGSSQNTEYPALFVAGNHGYTVRVRNRGAWARSWPKKSYKIIFESGQRFEGQSRINLNSTWRDIAYVREPLAYAIYREAGVPASQSRMVRLDVNGRFWGLYAEVEQPEERFLAKRDLEDTVLYKAQSRSNRSDERDLGSLEAFAREYEKETAKDESYQDLADFCRTLAASTDHHAFFQRHVELPLYLDYLCATTFTQNWDSYNKNHFTAKKGDTGRWFVIPWDLDRTLGDHWNWHFDAYDLSPFHGHEGMESSTGWNRMMDACFRTPELRRQYLERLQGHLKKAFHPSTVEKHLATLLKGIEDAADRDIERWGKNGPADWRDAVEEVRRVIRKRHAFLTRAVSEQLQN